MNCSERIAAVVCIVLLLGIAAIQTAFASQVTLAELKQQTPERLQMTTTTVDGEEITVDAPIFLPEGDTMPIILAQSATFDTTGLHDVFPFPDYYNQDYSKAQLQLMLSRDERQDATLCAIYSVEAKYKLTGRVDSTARANLPQGETPPENNVTVDDIMAFIMEIIQRFDCDTTPDLRVLKATAQTGLYSMKSYKTPEGWTEFTINEKKPVKSASMGIWDLDVAQYMHGIQVFGDYRPYASYLCPSNPNPWQWPVLFHVQYMDENNFNILFTFLKENQLLADDAPLLSYDSLVETIKSRIEEGKLKSIYGLTLGYAVRIVKGEPFYLDDAMLNQNPDVRFVLVPEWEILGFDEQDAATAASLGLKEPTENMILDPETYSRYGLSYTIRMDAATGAFILDYEAMEYSLP